MALLIDGKRISAEIKDELKEEVAQLKEQGITGALAVIQVGNDPASSVYVRNKKRACEYIGIDSLSYELPEETSQDELLALIDKLNKEEHVKGILVQLPLPEGIDEDAVIRAISPKKDVDGFHPENVGALMIGQKGYISCTPAGIIQLLMLSPDKGRHSIFRPMKQIAVSGAQSKQELTVYRHAPKFAPAGQSTQMIVGASPETDYHILKLTEGMYQKYSLKRVFYSAYIPVTEDTRLPALDTKPPLLREHRLYQADWLLRFYQFKADEILDEANQSFNPYLDPKCNWAVQHYGLFPVDVNRAPFEMLLRVPGIGPKSARRIWHARKLSSLGLDELKRMGVVLKRAQYFITCKGFAGAHPGRGTAGRERITQALIDPNVFGGSCEQLSLFTPPAVDDLITQGVAPRAAMRMVREEAVQCLAKAL